MVEGREQLRFAPKRATRSESVVRRTLIEEGDDAVGAEACAGRIIERRQSG